MYDQSVRDLLGYPWSDRDGRRHRQLGRMIHHAFKLVPHDRRYHPRARAGWKRVRGEHPVDASPVETPRRNLPPLAERDDPKHYSPKV
jgi:uncharacterized protein (DUF2236 family)